MKKIPLITVTFLLSFLLLAILTYSWANAAVLPTGTIVCIDPGHGGSDPGAVNGDLYESDINLDVSYGLKKLLLAGGADDVFMTREVDQYLTNSDRYTFCSGKQATILISVHTNSVNNEYWDGSLTLYAPQKNPAFARVIQDAMYARLRTPVSEGGTLPVGVQNFDDWDIDNFASGVLFKSDIEWTAMAEPVFMSHPLEAAALATPIFTESGSNSFHNDCVDFSCRRGDIAVAIYEGIDNFLNGQSADSPPMVTIASPAGGASFDSGALIPFSGTAVDNEDGNLSAGLIWTSSIDGDIGSSGSFSAVLSDGTHQITARVTDSANQTSSDSITISVGSPAVAEMHVETIEMFPGGQAGRNYIIDTNVTIVDSSEEHNPVPDAEVTLIMTYPSGKQSMKTAITNGDGLAAFTMRVRETGNYRVDIDSVSKAGWTYNAAANEVSSATLDIP